MSTFRSWKAFDEFESAVRTRRRFMPSESERHFLEAIRKTAADRTERLQKGHPLWRAQIGHTTVQRGVGDRKQKVVVEIPAPFGPERMIPDPRFVREGRLNPRGIAYFYMADNRDTSIAEVRPWVGAQVSVGVFEVMRDLTIVDCGVGPDHWDSQRGDPLPEQWDEVVWNRMDRAFARPVDPHDSWGSYAATQFLAEAFLEFGFDGIAYKSSLASGRNVSLFDTQDARLFACELYQVNTVKYGYQQAAEAYTRPRETTSPAPDRSPSATKPPESSR